MPQVAMGVLAGVQEPPEDNLVDRPSFQLFLSNGQSADRRTGLLIKAP